MDQVRKLLAATNEDFAHVVDAELKGRAPDSVTSALEDPRLLARWRAQLVRMNEAVSGTIEARDAESRADALEASQRGFGNRAIEIERRHLRWRANALRFRTGVRERLTEVEHLCATTLGTAGASLDVARTDVEGGARTDQGSEPRNESN